ncbi:MAG: hypothetical protein AAF968_03490 [Pseudomonadota bacterium]
MPRPLSSRSVGVPAVLSCVLAGLPTVSAHAQDAPITTVERPSPGFDRMTGVYDVAVERGQAPPEAGALALQYRLPIDGFSPADGKIEALTLTLSLDIGIILAGSIGDGLPLNEEGEEVATAVSLPLTLSVAGPDGHLLATRSLEALSAGCTGLRACAFAATARVPVEIAMTPLNHANFVDSGYLDLSLEQERNVVETFCPEEALWERCVIESVMLRLSAKEGGVTLAFDHRPAAPGEPPPFGRAAAAISAMLTGLAVLALSVAIIRRRRRDRA